MEMNSPVGRNVLDDSGEGVVGKPLDRVDGRLKVTGGAIYADEVQHAPQTAWKGKAENVAAAQRAFAHRASMNSLAARGEWRQDLERMAA